MPAGRAPVRGAAGAGLSTSAARIVRVVGMEPRPYRYRVEHIEPGQPPRILGAFLTFAAGTKALLLAAQQLAATETPGHVALIDQAADPELVIETHTMPASWGARPGVSEPTDHVK